LQLDAQPIEHGPAAKPIGVGIGIAVEIAQRKAAAILNPIAIPIPMPTRMMLFKPALST